VLVLPGDISGERPAPHRAQRPGRATAIAQPDPAKVQASPTKINAAAR